MFIVYEDSNFTHFAELSNGGISVLCQTCSELKFVYSV